MPMSTAHPMVADMADELRVRAERIEKLEAALRKIADEDYEPVNFSWTWAAALIARAALETK